MTDLTIDSTPQKRETAKKGDGDDNDDDDADEVISIDAGGIFLSVHSDDVQSFTKRWALGCVKFLPGPAWLVLSKTGPPFSASLYRVV